MLTLFIPSIFVTFTIQIKLFKNYKNMELKQRKLYLKLNQCEEKWRIINQDKLNSTNLNKTYSGTHSFLSSEIIM